MNEKMDKLQDIFETPNLIFIKELVNQLHYSNSDVSEASKEELPCGLKFEVQRVAKGQEIILDLITKLIDELDADLIHGMELLKDLRI